MAIRRTAGVLGTALQDIRSRRPTAQPYTLPPSSRGTGRLGLDQAPSRGLMGGPGSIPGTPEYIARWGTEGPPPGSKQFLGGGSAPPPLPGAPGQPPGPGPGGWTFPGGPSTRPPLKRGRSSPARSGYPGRYTGDATSGQRVSASFGGAAAGGATTGVDDDILSRLAASFGISDPGLMEILAQALGRRQPGQGGIGFTGGRR